MKTFAPKKREHFVRGVPSSLLLGVILLLPQLVWGGNHHENQAEVKADSLQIKNKNQEALFSGNVQFSFNGMSLQCDQLKVGYGDKGAIKSLVATGGVTVVRDNARATAERAEMNMVSGIISLSGNPRFTKERNTLIGRLIRVNIRTGEVDVTEASGTFYLEQEFGNE